MDTSRLSPADARVALLSLPRRYGEAVRHPEPDEPDWEDRLHRPGPNGRSVMELVVHTLRSLTLLARAVEEITVSDHPVLHPAITHRPSREFDVAAHGSLDDILDELSDVTGALAERVRRTATEDWLREGRVAGGGEITALEVIAEAVSTAVDNLREVEALVRGLRSGAF